MRVGAAGGGENRESGFVKWRETGQRHGFRGKHSKIFKNVQKPYRNLQKVYQNHTQTFKNHTEIFKSCIEIFENFERHEDTKT